MYVKPLRTPQVCINTPLLPILDEVLPRVEEGTILAITSKIVSLSEGRVVPKGATTKDTLVRQEATFWLDEGEQGEPSPYCLTITNNTLIPAAGIDESNGQGHFVLYPKDPFRSLQVIWTYIRKRDGIQDFGVIMTDSTTTPLRRGVTGISLAWCGFQPLRSYIGTPDIDGALLRVTSSNLVDGLAATAVLTMGEGDEQTPLAIMGDMPAIVFVDSPPSKEEKQAVCIPWEEDLYGTLLKKGAWRKGVYS